MAAILQSLLTFVLLYKYAGLFVITFLAALAVPLPSGTIAVTAFFFATQGYLNPWLIGLSVTAANFAGDMVLVLLTRRYGTAFLRRIGLGRVLDAELFHTFEAKLAAHPIPTVVVSRFTTAVTPLVNVLVGLADMALRTFIVIDLVAEAGEAAVNFAYGTFFGNNWTYVSRVVGFTGVLVLAAVGLVVVLLWHRRRPHRVLP